MTQEKLKRKIVELGKFLYDKGYIVATDGNISLRLNRDEMLITRRDICKGAMRINDIVKMSILKQNNLSAFKRIKPSTEYQLHCLVYQQRPEINAIIHTHPLFLTVYSIIKGKSDIRLLLLTETEETFGKIKLIGYLEPGSLRLARAVANAAKRHNVIILKHHGVVILGDDLDQAKYRLERLEFWAKISFLVSIST